MLLQLPLLPSNSLVPSVQLLLCHLVLMAREKAPRFCARFLIYRMEMIKPCRVLGDVISEFIKPVSLGRKQELLD